MHSKMQPQRHSDWTGSVFALVCDDNLNFAANALALELTTKVNVEIHVFIETKPNIAYRVNKLEHPRIIYHHNALFKEIAAEVYDNPRFSRAAWGRIMLPSVLRKYNRIIYTDIDVLPGTLDPHILNIELPHGIALVRDESDIFYSRNMLPNEHANFRIGSKYFNSDFMIIDPKNWNNKSTNSSLTKFFESGDAASAPYADQDFINVHFADRITELSPLYNFQYNSMKLGAVDPDRIAIRHFTGGEKPYYQTTDRLSRKIVEKGRELYGKLLKDANVSVETIPTRSTSTSRIYKAILRKTLSDIGINTRKTRDLHTRWSKEYDLFIKYLLDGSKGLFHDDFSADYILKREQPNFDGFEYYTGL